MNSIQQDARFEADLIYKSILDEAEVQFPYVQNDLAEIKTVNSNRQLFINAQLRNLLEETILLKITAQRKSLRFTKDVAEKRNEDILFKALKGRTQKQLSKDHQISIPAISKIITNTIKNIIGCVSAQHSAGELIEIYRVELTKYFIQKKIEVRYEHRNNNNRVCINNSVQRNNNINNGSFD